MATELAKAYVQIIPSAQGIQGSIANVMNGEGASAGESAGQSFASSFGSMAKKALVGLGIGKIIKDAIGNASEFETSMAKVSTLFDTTQGVDFDTLQQDILDLSSAYGLGATTLAEAAYSAESAGVAMGDLTSMLEGSAKLAVAGFTDIDTALSATAKTMNAYGDAAMSIDDIQKVLIQTQNLGITTVGELGASLANVTPTAAAMGVQFDQVGAALAQMTANGIPTAQATTQLRSAMTELGKAGTKADKAFREAAKGSEYAGMRFQEAMANGANLGDVFGMMQSYANATGQSMVDLWGSVEAGNAAMTIAADVDKFNKNLEAMATDLDVVGDAYGKMADTFGTNMNQLKESAKNFVTTLFNGGDVSKSFDQMLESLGNIGEKLKTWLTNGLKGLADNLPQLMGSLLDFGGSILESLAQVDWIELGTSILNGIIGALGTLGTRLIELVGGAISKIANGEVDFGEIGTAIWNGVTSVITTAGDWLKTLFNTAKDAVCGEEGIDFSGIGESILGGVLAFLDSAGQFLSNLFITGKDAVTDGQTINWNEVGDAVLHGLESAIDMAGHFLEGAFSAGATLVKQINWDSIGTLIGNAVNGVVDTAGVFLAGCFTAAKSLIEKIDWNNVGKVIGDGVNSAVDTAGMFLTGCFTTAKSLIEKIDWNNIGKVIGDGVNSAVDTAGAFLAGCFTAAKGLIESIDWENIGRTIASGVNGFIDVSGKFLESCFLAAKNLIEAIDWAKIGETIANGVNGTVDVAGKFLEGCFTAAKGLIEAIDWANIGATIGKGVNSTIDAAGKFLEDCFNAGLTLVESIEWSKIGTSISNGVTGTIDAAGQFLKSPFEAGKSLIEGMDWAGMGKSISDAISEGITGAGNLLGGLLSGAGSAVEGAGNLIGEIGKLGGKGVAWLSDALFGSDLETLKQAATDLQTAMTNLQTTIETSKKAIEDAAKKVGESIRDGIANELTQSKMEDIGYSAGENAMIGIDRGILIEETTVYDEIASVRKRVSNNFAAPTQWNDAGKKAMDKLADGIKAKFDKIKKGFEVLRGYGVETMMDESVWKSVGSNIVYGIVAGVHSAASSLEAAMKKIAKRALAAAKDELGISSPSKVMADQVGRWIPEGIAMGIERNADIVSDAMGELAEDSTLRPMTEMLARQPAGWSMETSRESQDDSENRFAEAIERALNRVNVYLGAEKVGRMTSGWVDQDIKAGDAALLRGMGG